MAIETTKVGRRGTVVLPAKMRRRLGIDEGSVVVVEERDDGILFRPAHVTPVEIYTPQRKAEFILNCAVGPDDYEDARNSVRELGVDPDTIPHERPHVRRRAKKA